MLRPGKCDVDHSIVRVVLVQALCQRTAVAVVEVHGSNGLVQRLGLPAPVRQLAAAGRAGRAVAVLDDRIVVLQIDR